MEVIGIGKAATVRIIEVTENEVVVTPAMSEERMESAGNFISWLGGDLSAVRYYFNAMTGEEIVEKNFRLLNVPLKLKKFYQ